ncbi:unnamed protein product [Effrenium voratum]|uniref:folate gamma-glutamyl hydrolase n=1 Tax=Effrenium voratum TaxID=2562239 RepID=A0AA36I1D3_9DINO|nr:unnamed protein product [Effrenium voratum]
MAVKYVESGAQAVPILYDWSDQELTQAFHSVNGVLLTGGDLDIADASPEAAQYMHAASLLLQLTVNSSQAGDLVPLWGTCLGLQTLAVAQAGNSSVLETFKFDTKDYSLPVEPAAAAWTSRLLRQLPADLRRALIQENITYNYHHDGVSPEAFQKNQRLAEMFSVLATNKDRHGSRFVSAIEGRHHPIYAVQFHPERSLYYWDADEQGINHSQHAVEVMRYFADFFISEARKNSHRFTSKAAERKALIYNYAPLGRSSYQSYVFPAASEMDWRTSWPRDASETMLV